MLSQPLLPLQQPQPLPERLLLQQPQRLQPQELQPQPLFNTRILPLQSRQSRWQVPNQLQHPHPLFADVFVNPQQFPPELHTLHIVFQSFLCIWGILILQYMYFDIFSFRNFRFLFRSSFLRSEPFPHCAPPRCAPPTLPRRYHGNLKTLQKF